MLKLLGLTLLVAVTACVPKPEEIKGCGSGQEFNSQSLSCVSSSPSILFSSSLLALADVREDQDYAFTLPDVTEASRSNVSGDLFWFITQLPENGTILGCANVDSTGAAATAGTSDRTCTYRPDPNYVGDDEFSYRVCNSLNGTSRCGQEIPVTVTVSDDGLDLPLLTVASGSIVYEGEDVFVDVRVSRRSAGESDAMYLCYRVTDPGLAFDGVPLLYQTLNPAVSSSGDGCISVGSESDNLNRVVASVSVGTQLFNACPNNETSCTKTAQYDFRLCQEVSGITDCFDPIMTTNLYDRATFSITVRPLNFRPAFPGSITFPLALTPAVSEELVTEKLVDPLKTAVSIGLRELDNSCSYDYCVERATDADVGQAISYEYSVATFNPGIAGTFVCTSAIQFPCFFTPAVDYNGAINFSYLARDAGNLATPAVSATLTVSAINDAPQFLAQGDIYGFRPAVSLGVALSENAESDRYSLKVGEGGGSYENAQRLTIRAEHVDPANAAVLPLENIRLYRGTILAGNLSANLSLDAANVDADTQLYSLTFEPADDVITAVPFDIHLILTDDSGASNAATTFTMRIKSVENRDDRVEILETPEIPESIGLQQGAGPKVIRFRVTPGPNDWKSDFGTQAVTITMKSSAPTVINMTQASIALDPAAGGVISVTGPTACTAGSCTWTATSNGSADPEDFDMLLTLEPGVRGASTLEMVASDGGTTDNVIFTANVFNFVATFNGWSRIHAQGPTVSRYASTTPGSVSFSWNDLTVTENGTTYSNYKIRVYRTSNDAGLFGAITNQTPSILSAGYAASVNDLTLVEGQAYDDGPGNIHSSGEKFFYMIGIVPNDTGDVIIPTATADQKLEIVIPPNNMALLHRWMVNMQFCQENGQVPDRTNNYRCFNQGLGAISASGFYYDQLEHVMMDRFENGCPYDIQEAGQTALASANPNKVHYNRSTGDCRYSNGASWVDIGNGGTALYATVPMLSNNIAQLPPLTNLERDQARAFCVAEKPKCNGLDCEVAESLVWSSITKDLPVRREMIMASTWAPEATPSNIEIWENGGNPLLGACNGNAASGLTQTINPVDSEFALVTTTVRALLNSGPRTSNCKSRYDVFNTMGNVGEWLADTLSCTAEDMNDRSACTLTTSASAAASRDASPANNAFGLTYRFSPTATTGQTIDLGVNFDAHQKIVELFPNPSSTTNRMHLALGLPYTDSTAGTVLGAPLISTSANPPSSFFPSYFGQDEIYFSYGGPTTGDVATSYAFVHGGGWRGVTPVTPIIPAAIGRFALEIRQNPLKGREVGHRCVVRLPTAP